MSDDGQTFSGTRPQRVIARYAANNVTFDQMDPPVTATRIGATVESVVLPAGTPATSETETPTT